MACTIRILVVDDEPGMRLGIERTMLGFTIEASDAEENITFATETAATGEAALERLDHCDLLLLDQRLPGLSGLEVLERINREHPHVLTIMITAYASLQTAITATKLGAYDFLAKPFTPEELRVTIRKAVRHLMLQQKARELAEEKKRIRFQFISVLAHELKAPLNAVEGNLRIAREKSAGDDPCVYDQMVDRSITRLEGMRRLIMDLLDMMRIESGQRKRDRSSVDLVEIARQSVETILSLARERGITVELHSPSQAILEGDRSEMEIILNNLLSNAVKYNRDNGRVDVTVRDEAERVVLEVRDTGIGISAQDAALLFQEFVRIRNVETRHVLGTGLGLSIVKKLTRLYGGDVTFQAGPGIGSTFTAVLGKSRQVGEGKRPVLSGGTPHSS